MIGSSSSISVFWLIPVVAMIVVAAAIFVSKQIRRSANDESLFDDDPDEAPANDGFNLKILLAVIPVVALVVWAVLSLTNDYGESFAEVEEFNQEVLEEGTFFVDDVPSH